MRESENWAYLTQKRPTNNYSFEFVVFISANAEMEKFC